LATVFAFQGNLVYSAYLVGFALILDFFDGFAARMLKVSGELGKQLDSLADMVTFGVVPGVIIFQMLSISTLKSAISNSTLLGSLQGQPQGCNCWMSYLPFAGFIITIFSAIRLAKFNIDIRQKDSFIGIPTPANAILICSLPLILDLHAPGILSGGSPMDAILNTIGALSDNHESALKTFILNPWFLVSLTVIMSGLMVAELPLFALKFKNFGWAENKMRYSFLLTTVVLLIVFRYTGIPIIIFLYVILSIINNFLNKYRNEVQG
jgi:CDP-diacylglycerol--serine O-phosphatidyltransferase